MRAGLIIVGIILLGLGIWVVFGNLQYDKTDTVLQVGSAKLEATSKKPVPAPVGYAGIVIGGVLIVAGVMKKGK